MTDEVTAPAEQTHAGQRRRVGQWCHQRPRRSLSSALCPGLSDLTRVRPACCACPSAGRHYDLTEIGLCCYAWITHTSDMDQPPATYCTRIASICHVD